ncbi:aldehyde dehydrogenase family protein [Dactylosporangium siamense]|uniref:2,5-dioxovalerate dehydrogenase n=1 Tax=Dactylosporangium siamense TaxID=685454 RepID=A0A919PTY3_9ACTN|nr:aldehyde dehydrogenase family protein [Dactylosporangium siamense]GIG48380.1 2,5-dioxovalerate dehydrogenase [Dactylosporangium siamense]
MSNTWDADRRRAALHALADALTGARDRILPVAAAETGLAEARLTAELERTTGQLRLLADRIATAGAAVVAPAAAAGGADVVLVRVPIGPVAVFAASNFPLAFGVLGGDTAAALAAGCPVVVKAHPAQPRTADLLAGLAAAVLPEGVFRLVHGGVDASLALVRDPAIRAVAFTGSPTGGRALMDAAAARPDPIPVFAEMGSLNPVFVLPSALPDPRWPDALAAAVTGSAGQLCTKPGLVVVPPTADGFVAAFGASVAAAGPFDRMLTAAMADAHARWLTRAAGLGVVTGGASPRHAFTVEVGALAGELLEEHFGPAAVVVRTPAERYGEIAAALPGSLTATVLAAPDDELLPGLLADLVPLAGRIVLNGVPTGVAVCDATHHGGPWPATSNPLHTSVGTRAVDRFLRPVALQGFPPELAAAGQVSRTFM